MRTVTVTVGNTTSEFALLDVMSPLTAECLWLTLPIEGVATHGRWAGSAVWTKTKQEPLATFNDDEVLVNSLYPGMMFVRKGAHGLGEVLISYGEAEARSYSGRGYATPVAHIIGAAEEFFAELKRTWTEGTLNISIARATG